MENKDHGSALVLGVCLIIGLCGLGYVLGNAALQVKELERTVRVKGLSEREYKADVVIWPIQFTEASNNLEELYESLEAGTAKITRFLENKGVKAGDISLSAPSITDKSAQSYSDSRQAPFRYTAVQNVTVYSRDVPLVRSLMTQLGELGKQGIAFTGGGYDYQTEYLFTQLNQVKPDMIKEATTKAREVALKFAEDSKSRLGKIKRASQGQFSITPRDRNNPHIKRVRVVSTVEYYLSD
ncbi:SIMPL domain-containing protein [Desulfoplanes formicivorans]|uniref:Periplasmic protein n=1 Tax=Desulfoplanes formicivorans TaxID=1592317 RepID=A0A194AGV0_9BACT|nr:SIMPL domain-containing protein [Desulfoplanes formicivorans]GAU08553.1 hypothetical protein DPF_1265 [Desulfoplanes formicivorans]